MNPSEPFHHPIVIHLGRLGDTVLLDCLLQRLHAKYRRPCVLIGAAPWSHTVYRHAPHVHSVWCLDRHTPLLLDQAWWRALRMLRQSDYCPLYICEIEPRRLARIRWMLKLAGIADERCVYLPCDPDPRHVHWADRLAAFAQHVPTAFANQLTPGRTVTDPSAPCLAVSEQDRSDCVDWLKTRGLSNRQLILVQPGNRKTMRSPWRRAAADDPKSWPIEYWGELVRHLRSRQPDAHILLCGVRQEATLLRQIHDETDASAQVHVVHPDLRQLFALCEQALCMVSVDTGPAHVAAAFGLPLLVLFGEQEPQFWLPRSPCNSPVHSVGGPPHVNRLGDLPLEHVLLGCERLWLSMDGMRRAPRAVVS